MDVIDSILNFAALLIWFNWRSLRFDPLARTSATSLAGTLRRAEPRSTRGWQMLLGLALLLFLRALGYWLLGAPVEWTPKMHLGVVVLAFRADAFGAMLLYSGLGFVRLLLIVYFWLLAFAVCNRKVSEPDAVLRLMRLHLGRVLRLPRPVLLLALPLGVAGLWALLHPILVWAGVLASVQSLAHLLWQGLLLSLALVLTLKFVLPVILLLHFVTSYVYLGGSPFWDFVATTARGLLALLRWLPLRVGKLDLGPLAAIVLILAVLHWVPTELAKRGFATWPQ
jgi:hypothetical protein